MNAAPKRRNTEPPAVPAKQVIIQLSEKHGLIKDDGSVNALQFSTKTGIPQSTVSRLLHSGPERRMNSRLVNRIAEAFGVSHAEAMGEVPLKGSARKITPTVAELDLIKRWRELGASDRDEIAQFWAIKAQLSKGSR